MRNSIFLFFVVFLFASCGGSSVEETKSVFEEDKFGRKGSSKGHKLYDSPAYIEKYNSYIDFGNGFHSRVNESYDRYHSWVDPEIGPNANSNVFGMYTMSEHYLNSLEESVNAEPEMKNVDPLMKEVLAKATALHKITNEADSYYNREDYKDDNFARAKELHPKLLAAFDEYYIAYEEMDVEFRKVQNELFEYDAKKYKEAGQMLRYNLMFNLHEAEKVLDIIGMRDGEQLKEIDLNAFDTQVAKFRETFDELEELAKDSERVKAEVRYGIDSYMNSAEEFITETRDLKERIQNNDFEYGITHPSIPDDGSPLAVEEAFSDMVHQYNRII